jgi:hypothetical protein
MEEDIMDFEITVEAPRFKPVPLKRKLFRLPLAYIPPAKKAIMEYFFVPKGAIQRKKET